jgi:sortase A
MLVHVGWQLWGTNWVSHREQDRVTRALESQWERGGSERVPEGSASALVRIPRFGKSYVVPVHEGVAPDLLAKGFGHFTKSADPGQVGNYALAAHRVTHGEPLRRMPELRPGDEVIVETADARHVYRLDTDPEKLVIPFTGVWVLDPLPRNPQEGGVQPAQREQRLITLTTCSEIFHTDNRMIAFGHLVRTVAKDR